MRTGIALAGFGYWGVNLARNIAGAPTTDLVLVVEPDLGRHELIGRMFPGVQVTSTLAAALEHPAVEGVVLATPAGLHGTMALEVIESGRHVLVEKPLALDVATAASVVAAADRAGLVLMVGHTFLYSPPVRVLGDLIRSGALGRIQYIACQRLSLGRIRNDCNALWNLAPHDVSILLTLLGESPAEVSARSFRFIQPAVDDVFFASLSFPGGAGANIHVSWVDPRKTRLVTVVGDQKMAVYDDVSPDRKIWIHDAGVARSGELGPYGDMAEFQWRTRVGDILIPHIEMTEPLLAEITDFGRCCQTGQQPVANGASGLEVVRILAAIDESAALGGAPTRPS